MAELSPEVREALARMDRYMPGSWPAAEYQTIRAELMRLAEECAELRAMVENAPVILLDWINGSFSATVDNHRMIEQQELQGKRVALVVKP